VEGGILKMRALGAQICQVCSLSICGRENWGGGVDSLIPFMDYPPSVCLLLEVLRSHTAASLAFCQCPTAVRCMLALAREYPASAAHFRNALSSSPAIQRLATRIALACSSHESSSKTSLCDIDHETACQLHPWSLGEVTL